MVPTGWFKESLVSLDAPVATMEELLAHAAERMAAEIGVGASAIARRLLATAGEGGTPVGNGVAIPHTTLDGISRGTVMLVRPARPLPSATPDGAPLDLVFVMVSPADSPRVHLLLLAHVARCVHSRVLVEGLRQASNAAEAVALVRAAELRLAPVPIEASESADADKRCLMVITIAGEAAVDDLLVEMIDLELPDATILEGQSLRQAAATEVPLFASFRDLFGDPGGRRVVLVEVNEDRIDEVTELVKRISEERQALEARVAVMPLELRWERRVEPKSAPKRH